MAGCTAGPNFKAPDPPTSLTYTAPGEAGGGARDRQAIAMGENVTAQWWTLFRSPQLDGLVRQAIAGSRTLAAARSRLASAQVAITISASALYPEVDFNASVARERVNASAFGLSPSQFALPPNFNLFQVGPTARYDLDLAGGRRRELERANALADHQRYEVAAAYMTLTGNTVDQAVLVAALRAQLKAINDILAIDRQNLGLVQAERAAGAAPDSDVVIAQTQLANDQTLVAPLEQQVSVAKHALSVLLGQAPSEGLMPDFDLDRLTLPEAVPVSLPSVLVRRRPDILAAEAQLHADSAQVGVAEAQLYPDVTLSASAGLEALDPGHLFNPTAFVWSIAAGLAQPLFDAGVRQAQRRVALEDFKASAADYQQVVLQAFGQVADLLQALNHDADQLAAQKRALDSASESVRLQRINFGAGGTGVLNLLEAQRQYQQAVLGYVRAEARRFQDTAQLLVAMGGGWWATNLATPEPAADTCGWQRDVPLLAAAGCRQ